MVQLQDLSGRANHMTAASAGVRPPVATSSLLSPLLPSASRQIMQFTSVGGQWLRKTSSSMGGALNPITIVMMIRQVSWASGALMLCYGATNLPRVRQNGTTNQSSFMANSLTVDSFTTGSAADGGTGLGGFGDNLWRVIILSWDGTTQKYFRSNLQTRTMDLEHSDANALTAIADGATLALGATVTGTGVANFECSEAFLFRGVDSSLNASILDYFFRNQIGYPSSSPTSTALEIIMVGDSLTTGTDRCPSSHRRPFWENLRVANPDVNFCGTITTRAYDQPAGYPSGHEAISGQTIADIQLFAVGFWSGTNVVPGQSGSPAPGARGDFEVLAAKPAGQGSGINNGGAIIILQGGNNDASGGPVDTAAFTRLVERVINTHGRVRRCYVCKLIPRTDSVPASTNLETFNTAIPGLIAAMQADTSVYPGGYPVALLDWSQAGGYNPANLQADGLHPTAAGCQYMADVAYATLKANGDLV